MKLWANIRLVEESGGKLVHRFRLRSLADYGSLCGSIPNAYLNSIPYILQIPKRGVASTEGSQYIVSVLHGFFSMRLSERSKQRLSRSATT